MPYRATYEKLISQWGGLLTEKSFVPRQWQIIEGPIQPRNPFGYRLAYHAEKKPYLLSHCLELDRLLFRGA